MVLVGANGAGKSTIMRTISSVVPLSQGRIWFEDRRLDLVPPHKIVEHGIAHVPEARQLFPEMSVLENLELGSLSPRPKQSDRSRCNGSWNFSPVFRNAGNSWPARCLAASSRCVQLPEASCQGRK